MNPLIQLKITTTLLIALALFGFALLPKAQAVARRQKAAIPTSPRQKGPKPFSASPPVCQHSSWLVFALYQRSGQLQHRYRRGSLLSNTADQNTAFGAAALLFNTTGINNTAVGAAALSNNTTAEGNTANGAFALFSNTEGLVNTASGAAALNIKITGSNNTAYGEEALENTAIITIIQPSVPPRYDSTLPAAETPPWVFCRD